MRLEIYIGVILLLAISDQADGIDCYECASSSGEHCQEVPNGAALVKSGHVSSGCPSCVKEFKALGTVFSTVTRRCGDSSETTDECRNVIGYGKCVCTTTFCNHGNSLTTSKYLLIIITTAFLSLWFCCSYNVLDLL